MQKKTQTVENIHQNHIERYFSALPQSSFDAVASPSTVEGSQRPILQETSLGVWRHWMLPRLYKSRILCRSRRITVALSSHQSHFSWQSTDKWPSTLATSNLSKTHVIWDIDSTSIKNQTGLTFPFATLTFQAWSNFHNSWINYNPVTTCVKLKFWNLSWSKNGLFTGRRAEVRPLRSNQVILFLYDPDITVLLHF